MRNLMVSVGGLAMLPLAAAFAASPPAAPARPPAFARCAACHSVVQGGPNGIGPNLFGVVGRQAGGVAGYAYSPSLKASRTTWTRATLDRYIADPKAIAPAGKMPPVVTTPADRQAIIAYLAGLK